MTVTIRPSRPDDAAAILAVVSNAFSDDTRDAEEELAIVRITWAVRRGRSLLELVADDAGAVVGHAQAAPGRLDGRETLVAGVAPVCVAPAANSFKRSRCRSTTATAWAGVRPAS